jgi:hypothetical protein
MTKSTIPLEHLEARSRKICHPGNLRPREVSPRLLLTLLRRPKVTHLKLTIGVIFALNRMTLKVYITLKRRVNMLSRNLHIIRSF